MTLGSQLAPQCHVHRRVTSLWYHLHSGIQTPCCHVTSPTPRSFGYFYSPIDIVRNLQNYKIYVFVTWLPGITCTAELKLAMFTSPGSHNSHELVTTENQVPKQWRSATALKATILLKRLLVIWTTNKHDNYVLKKIPNLPPTTRCQFQI